MFRPACLPAGPEWVARRQMLSGYPARTYEGEAVMGFFTRDIKTIDDLFVHGLRDIYYAEHQIMQSLPDMIEKAHDPQLKQRLHLHLSETINHIDRLEDVFSLYGTDPRHLNCRSEEHTSELQSRFGIS